MKTKILNLILLVLLNFGAIAQDTLFNGLELLKKYDYGAPTSGMTGSMLGSVGSNIGDVNGDGFGDWALGSIYATDTSTLDITGQVYIYFGSGTLVSEQNPDLILQGEYNFDRFGCSVSSAGDVNNDGYSDVLVGAKNNDTGGIDAGCAYLYFGGATMDNIADIKFTSNVEQENFGYSVNSAGDLNDDGFDDIIIGSYNSSEIGKAYIYFGGATMDNVSDLLLVGNSQNDAFGNVVSGAGDINGDGFDDVLIGASNSAFIFFGGDPMNSISDVSLSGKNPADLFGAKISSAGDVNGDGYADVLIGATNANVNSKGEAYIYLGGLTIDNVADITFVGDGSNSNLGTSLSTAGDVNNDGFDDVIISQMNYVYVYYGGIAMDSLKDVFFVDGDYTYNPNFGSLVSFAGDVDNDGFDDVILGSSQHDGNGTGAGRAYICYGGNPMDMTKDLTFSGKPQADNFGAHIANAGDVNNDGFDDILVGINNNDNAAINAGIAYLYLGGPTIDNIADVTFTGEASGDEFGISVSSAGDVNNDGYDDIIIGAYGNDFAGQEAGKAYIYFGGSSMNNNADVIIVGLATSDRLGCHVSSAGDVNNDGFDDVIVGAYNNDTGGSNAGCAYVYLGGASMDSIADVTFLGSNTNDFFGERVTSAGDLNNDGFDDVMVSAYRNGSGKVYVYFGSASMNNVADLILTGDPGGNYFGRNTSAAGDMNNDSYNDVIVGANGKAYVFYGASAMDNTADITYTGKLSNENFGTVSSAGDINNDGYTDVIVGASSGLNETGTNTGRVYVYFGGLLNDNNVDIVLTGEHSGDQFGESLTFAGDVNGDGISEIFIGSPYSNAAGYQMGRAQLYAGKDFAPSKPLNITVSPSSNTINLDWNPNFELDLAGYRIYRDSVFDRTTLYDSVKTGSPIDTFFIDQNVVIGTTYYYKITAFDNLNLESGYSTIMASKINTAPIWTIPDTLFFAENDSLIVDLDSLLTDISDADSSLIVSYSGGANISVLLNNETHTVVLKTVQYFNGTDTLIFSAIDSLGLSQTDTVTIIVKSINNAPVLAGIPDVSFNEDTSKIIYLNKFVTDIDHDTTQIHFTAQVLENSVLGVSINSISNIATLAASPDSNGVFTVVFTAIDDSLATDIDTINVVITPINDIPFVIKPVSDTSIMEDSKNNLLIADLNQYFGDVETSSLVYSTYGYNWQQIDVSITNDSLFVTPYAHFYGNALLIVSARDANSASINDTLTIYVQSVDDAPVFDGLNDFTFSEDDSTFFNFQYFVSDVDNLMSEINITASAIGTSAMNFKYDPVTTIGRFIPLPDSNGIFTVVVTATDIGGASGTDTVVFTVTPVNDAPVLINPLSDTLTITEDVLNAVLANDLKQIYYDADGDPLIFSIDYQNRPNVTLRISGDTLYATPEPDYYDISGISFDISATDGYVSAGQRIVIKVQPVNDPPVLDSLIPDITINEEQYFFKTDVVPLFNYFNDIDDQVLSYNVSATGGNGLTLTTDGNYIELQTAIDSFGFYTVYITATDLGGAFVSDTFNITVLNINDAPIINYHFPNTLSYPEDIGTITIASLDSIFYDKEDDALEYILTASSDTGLRATLIENTIQITTKQDYNDYIEVTISANDGQDTVEQQFYISIFGINDAPHFISSFSDTTVYLGNGIYKFTWSYFTDKVIDVDNENLSFKIYGNYITLSSLFDTIFLYNNSNWIGIDTIWVIADDGNLSDTTSFLLTILPDEPPVSYNLFLSQNGLFIKNYPNPFSGSTTFEYKLTQPSSVRLVIYDLKGKEIKTLINNKIPAGLNQISWDGCNMKGNVVSNGAYIYILYIDEPIGNNQFTVKNKLMYFKK